MEEVLPHQNLQESSTSPVLRRLGQLFLVILFVGLCVTNFLLIQQNRELRATIAHKEPEFAKVGEFLPPLAAKNLNGQQATINFKNSEKTVLFVFAPGCVPCERTVPYWRDIAAVGAHNQYQVFGLSLGDEAKSAAFLASNTLTVETFANLDKGNRDAYKLTVTPITIVVDRNGNVEKIWPGAFNSEMKLDVESYFGISVNDDVR